MKSTAKEKKTIEKLCLQYYNDVLLQKGLITKEEHRKMKLKILGQQKNRG